jgi:hypothetical protein
VVSGNYGARFRHTAKRKMIPIDCKTSFVYNL